ncbi:MAG: hypothetical protein K1X75_12855 [Leptospirales bacterium]|nr:hypothetical protein [Leptospirales bacterium]
MLGRASLILSLLLLGFAACQSQIQGQFGWATTDDRELSDLERTLLSVSEYRIGRDGLYFRDYETLWWIYQIDKGPAEEEYLVALYENNTTPQPVAVDLRRVRPEKIQERVVIRQNYEQLSPGRYLLKIAHNSMAVDQVEFMVTPEGGPASLGVAEELDDPEPGAEVDDIRLYSGYAGAL